MLKYIYMYINMYKLQLHYANGHGLRDPGVGGQEDVIEHLVGGAPFLVRASGMCVYVYMWGGVKKMLSSKLSAVHPSSCEPQVRVCTYIYIYVYIYIYMYVYTNIGL